MRKPWDQWHPVLFYGPVYCSLFFRLFFSGMHLGEAVKANYGLPLGGVGYVSKKEVNELFLNRREMLRFTGIMSSQSLTTKISQVNTFLNKEKINYPFILKPDTGGRVGKGVILILNRKELKEVLQLVDIDYLVQEYCNYPEEYSVFYYYLAGKSRLYALDQKIFPYVIGTGKKTVRELVQEHPEFCYFEQQYNQKVMKQKPKKNEKVLLSVVGNYAQGGVFIDQSKHITKQLTKAVEQFVKDTGFCCGRLDIKAKNIKDLKSGKFKVIEVNGTDALATTFHDPKYSLREVYKILFGQAKIIAQVARENRNKKVAVPDLFRFTKKLRDSERRLEENHQRILTYKRNR